MSSGSSRRYCVIGAGANGLAALRTLVESGFDVDCFEREPDVGGVWNIGQGSRSVCASTHLISSKRNTEFSDFPMPAELPPYPSHAQVLEYLRSYATRYDLLRHITFDAEVRSIDPVESGAGWMVQLGNGEQRHYRAVLIANGHHWDAQKPKYAGTFAGEILHARQYCLTDQLKGRRVLVVGCGNSGCDIAVDAARNARSTLLSVRRGRHFVPKFLFGRPIDEGADLTAGLRVPRWLQRLLGLFPLHAALGPPQAAGLPRPDHGFYEEEAIPTSLLPYEVGHGRIKIKPDIVSLEQNQVRFADQSIEEVDLIIFATGYRISLPFLSDDLLTWDDGVPRLFLNIFAPQREGLYFIGLSDPSSRTWSTAAAAARLVAAYERRAQQDPAGVAWFRRRCNEQAGAIGVGRSPKSRFLKIEYHDYMRRLGSLTKALER